MNWVVIQLSNLIFNLSFEWLIQVPRVSDSQQDEVRGHGVSKKKPLSDQGMEQNGSVKLLNPVYFLYPPEGARRSTVQSARHAQQRHRV